MSPFDKHRWGISAALHIRFCVQRTWACVSHVLKLRCRKEPSYTDNETTSPRIYVNRRTPSCLLLNFPDSRVQDRSASLRFPIRVLRVHVCKSSKNGRDTSQLVLGAKIRNNYEINLLNIKILAFIYMNTSMPFRPKIQHSRVWRIWLESSSLNFLMPL